MDQNSLTPQTEKGRRKVTRNKAIVKTYQIQKEKGEGVLFLFVGLFLN